MRNSIGYFKVWRELFDKPIWKQSTPAQKSILMTIFYLANWKEKKWEWCGEPYMCKEGEFITSHNSIMEAAGKGITIDHVRTALKRFEKLEFLTIKSPKNKRGGIKVIITNWDTYQKEETRTKTEIIPIKSILNPEQIPTIEEDKNIRSKENSIFIKPSLEEVKQYCIERKNSINPEKWLAYYESNGWMVGKSKMKDWKAAVRTWESNVKQFSNTEKSISCLTGTSFVGKYDNLSEE